MVYVRLIREEVGKTICENLHTHPFCFPANGSDRIVVSDDPNTTRGYIVTQEDFESLFRQKRSEAMKQIEAQKSAQQKETEKQLEEMKQWKAETEGKGFVRQVAALWKWRKQK